MNIFLVILFVLVSLYSARAFGGGISIQTLADMKTEKDINQYLLYSVDNKPSDTVLNFIDAVKENNLLEAIRNSPENRKVFEKLSLSLKEVDGLENYANSGPDSKAILAFCIHEIKRIAEESHQRSINRNNSNRKLLRNVRRKTLLSLVFGPVAAFF